MGSSLTVKHKIVRLLWGIVWTLFAKPFPRSVGNRWKCFLLRLFGAKISKTARVYSSTKVYYPANLVMGEYSCLGPDVDCYNVDKVILKNHVLVSQKAYLCTASHNYNDKGFPLITSPIMIENEAWVAADTFISMGVTVGEGAVVGARAAVYKDVDPWTIVGGNPAKIIGKREKNSFYE